MDNSIVISVLTLLSSNSYTMLVERIFAFVKNWSNCACKTQHSRGGVAGPSSREYDMRMEVFRDTTLKVWYRVVTVENAHIWVFFVVNESDCAHGLYPGE